MNKEAMEVLGRYNRQVDEGLMHTRRWIIEMHHLQKKFDEDMEKVAT